MNYKSKTYPQQLQKQDLKLILSLNYYNCEYVTSESGQSASLNCEWDENNRYNNPYYVSSEDFYYDDNFLAGVEDMYKLNKTYPYVSCKVNNNSQSIRSGATCNYYKKA